MKAQSFFGGLGWLLVANLLVKPAWIFLIDRQVQNAVGTEAYGEYFALFNLTYVLLVVADAGLATMLTQNLAAGSLLNKRKLLQTKLFFSLAYIVVSVFAGLLTGVTQWTLLLFLIAIQTLSSLFVFLRAFLTAHQLFKTDAVFSVLDKTLLVLLCAGPVYGIIGRISLPLFLQLQLIATLTAVVCLFAFCWRRNLLSAEGESHSLFQTTRKAAPFLLIILLMAAHYRLDGFLLERLRADGATQAGRYAMAYRLLDAGNMLGYLCASFLVPFIARNRQQTKRVNDVVVIVRSGLLLAGFAVAAFVFVFSSWLQAILYHTRLPVNDQILSLCIAVLPAYYLTHVYGSVLTGLGALKIFLRILCLAVALNIACNLFLIPWAGALGSCVAAVVSQYVCGLLLWFYASQKAGFRFAAKSFFSCVLFGGCCWILFRLCKTPVQALWVTLALGSLAAILLFATQKALVKRWLSVFNS